MFARLLRWGRHTRVPRFLGICALFGLVLTGCGAPAGDGTNATPTPLILPASGEVPTLGPYELTDADGAPFPVPSTEANPILTVNMEEAWGSGLNITEIPASVDGEHVLILRGVADDGSFIVATLVARSSGQGASKLVVMDVDSRQITEIAEQTAGYQAGPHRAYGAWGLVLVDGESVVWHEGTTLKVYNVSTRAVTKIDRATDAMTGGVPGFDKIPSNGLMSVDNGIAVWAEGSDEAVEQDRVASVVKTLDLATGHTAVIGKHGINPSISWPLVAWIEPDLSTENTEDGLVMSRIITLNLQSGLAGQAVALRSLDHVAAHRDALVYTEQMTAMAYLENLAQTRRQVIAPMTGAHKYNLSINDRLVTWHSDGVAQVWDRALNRIVSLEGYSSGREGRVVNGHTLAWQTTPNYMHWVDGKASNTPPDDFTIYLMDTSQLSK